jgi:hypothetical protein
VPRGKLEIGFALVVASVAVGIARTSRAADAPPPPAPTPTATPPAASRPVALYISGCPGVTEEGVRRIVAVELGPRLLTAGSPVPPNVDRLIVSCRGQQARLEAGDPASPRYAERTLALDRFPSDGGTRAVALAALELLAALDRPRTPPPATAALDEYEQKFVWFYDGTSTFGRKFVPYRGKYHEPLAGTDFYEAIERPDLVSAYHGRQALNITMFVGGTALFFYAFASFQQSEWLGLGCWLGGTILGSIGFFRANDPVDEPTARRFADEHNRRLKRRLGLPSQMSPDQSPQPVMRGWHVSAVMSPAGGALALKLNF